MEYVTLGKTGLNISRLGFGGIPIQRVDAEITRTLVHTMAEKGINFIDTARGYTVSEEYLGYALEGIRDKFVLATKSMSRTKEAMAADIDYEMKELKVDGGASSNNFLMQFQSDISNINVVRPKVTEATAQGAAFLAGLAVGFFSNREELKAINRIKDVFYSSIDQSLRENLLDGWGKAIEACKKS